MNKEPIGLYIFRFILGFALLGFMAMLYWSSTLIEQRLQEVQLDIGQIQNEIKDLRGNISKGAALRAATLPQIQEKSESKYSNLLTVDPFYTTTLPAMLGPDFKPHGVRREATIGKPDNLHPFNNWAGIVEWYGLCTAQVASLAAGKYEVMAPGMAERMELRENEKGEPEYWIFLRQDAFWKPLKQKFFGSNVTLAPHFLHKHPVTAHDFKLYYDAFMNPHVAERGATDLRTVYGDIVEFTVIDDHTFKVRWKTEMVKQEDGSLKSEMIYRSKAITGGLMPLPCFVYQYFPDGKKIITDDANPDTYRTNPIWAQNFSHHWAKNIIPSCGPWEFDGLTDQEIRFVRNDDFFNPLAALTEGIEYKFKNSSDAIWEEFKMGGLDTYSILPQQLSELDRFMQSGAYKDQEKQGLGIKRLDYVARQYWYISMNEARPIFKSKKVRQAMNMAIDRDRIIRQTLNGLGMQTTGTFFPYSSSYDKSIVPYPYNPQKALQLLHEDGWFDSTGDGILDKVIDGQQVSFTFTLTYFVKNTIGKSICEYIATTLKDIGIQCNINGVEVADLSAMLEDRNFDTYFLAWGLGTPPEDPRQIWYSAGASEKGSSNVISFSNHRIDAIIDQLDYEYDQKKRIELFHEFDKILYEEAPYVFLYVPTLTLIYRDYLQNVFLPAQRQDLIPEADVIEPVNGLFWIKEMTPTN